MSSQEPCQKCSRFTHLELFFNTRLCKQCHVESFHSWKNEQMQTCQRMEANLDYYKSQMDMYTPIVNANLQTISSVKDQIRDSYNNLIRALELEKDQLMQRATECENDNKKFNLFKNDINDMKRNLADFKEETTLYEDRGVTTLVNKYVQCNQFMQTADRTYNVFLTHPIKSIERFDRAPLNTHRLIGDLRVVEKPVNAQAAHPVVEATRMMAYSAIEPRQVNLYPNISQAGPPLLRAAPAPPSSSSLPRTDEKNFAYWREKCSNNPMLNVVLDKAPIFLASHRNYLFVVDEKDIVSVMSMDSNNNMKHEDDHKIPVPNIKAIAASQHFFGITYSDLDKKQLKNKRYKASGVILFARDLNVINFSGENLYELKNGESFEAPIGISITEDFVFACDKTLKAVFKFSVKTREVLNRINMDAAGGGAPYKLSANRHYLTVTEPTTHRLRLYSADTLALIKDLVIDQPDKKNGPFTVLITSDNIIFFKNYPGSQLTFVDAQLSNEQVFTRITDNIEGFAILENGPSQTLVVGCTDKKSNFKLVCFKNI